MLLAPSDIQFLRVGATNLGDLGDLGDLSKDYAVSNFALPKLQVAGKNGAWFALNNSLLHVVRELERLGKCDRVKVDVVSLSKVPTTVQRGMVVQPAPRTTIAIENDNCKTSDPSRETKRGYEKLPDRTLDESKTDATDDDDDDDDDCSSSDGSDAADRVNSDSESDQDEDLTCNVCDRSFASTRLLARHQQKRRHFACSVCESLFSSLIMLEHHKEEYDHWSEDEGDSQDSEDEDDDADDETGTKKSEEMERLL